MLQLLFGAAAGAAAMYFGSDVVADNCARAAYHAEQAAKNQALIDQRALETIAQWATNGTLQQELAKLTPPTFSQQFPQNVGVLTQ